MAAVWVKDESFRLGLPSFKILGASWAVYRALEKKLGHTMGNWNSLEELRGRAGRALPGGLIAATDGNHGRAVARVAAWLKVPARVLVPSGTSPSRREAIRVEGAELQVVEGDYDKTVAVAASLAGEDQWLIQDTAWPGYREVPRWVVEGYATIFLESGRQFREKREGDIDLVAVQIGVGSLAAAAVRHFKHPARENRPVLVGVEPEGADCAYQS
ncbi:MAG: pyridoxal-phosphate dependent enzyme, partial [Candidatus Krumholzibacteriota bacterium]|nr:pyridoxal-phosphate dependent enzyme [Candidatus Krumholzibacteriota bacterium]